MFKWDVDELEMIQSRVTNVIKMITELQNRSVRIGLRNWAYKV